MPETMKVLVGAIAGLIAGLIAEPIRRWVVLTIDTRTVKRALREDLSLIYLTFCHQRGTEDWQIENFRENLEFATAEKYLYYSAKKAEACYELLGWSFVKGLFEKYLEVRSEGLNGQLNPTQCCDKIERTFLEFTRFSPEGSILTEVEDYYERRGYPRLGPEIRKKEVHVRRTNSAK